MSKSKMAAIFIHKKLISSLDEYFLVPEWFQIFIGTSLKIMICSVNLPMQASGFHSYTSVHLFLYRQFSCFANVLYLSIIWPLMKNISSSLVKGNISKWNATRGCLPTFIWWFEPIWTIYRQLLVGNELKICWL